MTLDASLPNLNDALLRQEIEQTFASDEADAQDGYRLAAANASTARAQLVVARNADAAQVAQLEKDRNQVQAAQDQLVALEAQVKGKIAALVAEIQHEEYLAEQAAEEARLAQERAAEEAQAQQEAAAAAAAAAQARATAAAQAQAQAQQRQAALAQANAARAAADQSAGAAATTTVPAASTTTVPASSSAEGTTSAVPGVSSAASAAVAAAEGRVGDPYVWGAAGPDAFDCSGLVMWAYAQAGVYLPHYSGSQYDETIHIPMSDLEPGDLVFPADPGVHVAMYIGNGEIVQAPYTGADVQIVPLTGYFVLASRVG